MFDARVLDQRPLETPTDASVQIPVSKSLNSLKETVDPDMTKTFDEIVMENGFIFEEHPVITSDGYKLNLFRIRSENTPSDAPAVLLQHGILDSAICWITHRADVAPAFQLVRAGYDVWLGNQRGSRYSRGH